MGGFDLYGQYYPNRIDAENAEMAQCAEIDGRITQEETRRSISSTKESLAYIWQYVERLEQRITELENNINPKPNKK